MDWEVRLSDDDDAVSQKSYSRQIAAIPRAMLPKWKERERGKERDCKIAEGGIGRSCSI